MLVLGLADVASTTHQVFKERRVTKVTLVVQKALDISHAEKTVAQVRR